MKKTVYLDLDGTIADLYNIENWLPRLKASDEKIFLECKPIITEAELLSHFPTDKYEIRVLSMTPLGATKEYCKNVEEQKNQWLDKFFPSLTKRIYRAYGHNKNLKNSENAILVDDSEPIRNSWRGTAINPAELWG
jgi:5'(3')-deoxyribonucleotidase